MRPLSGIVLVGGLGTRSRAAFLSGPKSMAMIGDRPFLEYLLAKLRADGIRDVVLCVGYRRSEVWDHFRKGTKWGIELRYSVETELLGNAGAVKKAASMIDADSVFVFNGDSYLGLDAHAMLKFHLSRNALATVALVPADGVRRHGGILVGGNGVITSFRNKSGNGVDKGRGKSFANAGTYLLNRQFIDLIPDGRPLSLENEMVPMLLQSGVYGFVTDGYFIDIGIPNDLARAQYELPRRKWR